MKRWKQALKRATALFLAAAVVATTVDISAIKVAAEENATVDTVYEIVDLPTIETSAQSMGVFTLDGVGNVALKSGNYTNWIERLDLTDADYARSFYDWLVENSDPATAVANSGETALVDPTGDTSGEIVCVDTDSDQVGDTYAYVLKVFTGLSEAEVTTNWNAAFAYITAVYNAFDRDCPEVFWLSGASRMMRGTSRSNDSGYTLTIYFVLKSNAEDSPFDVRAAAYQDTTVLKNAINDTLVKEGNARASVLSGVAADADTYETVKYFNEWLTKNNCYNANVNTATHNARECTGALNSATGTDAPVCEAYARAFKVLCDAKSIPCVLVDGTAVTNSGSGAHMWNYVQMDDGKWYAVDVTWNDPTVSGVSSPVSGRENENYFLVGSGTEIGGRSFIESHPVSNIVTDGGESYVNGPELEESAYVYETASGNATALTVAGVTVDTTQDSTGEGWSYDYDTNTLSFTAAVTGNIVATGDLTIAIDGLYTYRGNINVTDGDLTFSGNGNLKIFGTSSTEGNINVTNGGLTVNGTGSLVVHRAVTADSISIGGNIHFAAKKGLSVKPVVGGEHHWKSGNQFESSNTEITTGDYEESFEYVSADHVTVTASTSVNSLYTHVIKCEDSDCWLKLTGSSEYHVLDENNGYACMISGCTGGAVALVTGGSGEDAYVVPVYYFEGKNKVVENPELYDGALIWAKSGDAIKLLQDITIATNRFMNFQAKGDYYVDLNGYSLDVIASPFDLDDGSTVTIVGNGTFITTNPDANISAGDDFVGYIKTTSDSTTTVYGQVPLTENLTIAAGETYNFVNGAKLALGEYTVTNNGTILVDGVEHVHNSDGEVSAYVKLDDANHLKATACLDCPIGYVNETGASEKHTYVEGVCSLCETVCAHTSVTDGTCDNCLMQYAAGVSDGDVLSYYMDLEEAVEDANTRNAETTLTVYKDYTGDLEINRVANGTATATELRLDMRQSTIDGDVTVSGGSGRVRVAGNGVITGTLKVAKAFGGNIYVERCIIGGINAECSVPIYVYTATILGDVVVDCHTMLGDNSSTCIVKGTITGGANSKIYLNSKSVTYGTLTSNGGLVCLGNAEMMADTDIVLNDGAQINVTQYLLSNYKVTVKAPEGVVAVPSSSSTRLYAFNFVSADGYSSVKNDDGTISFVCEHTDVEYTWEETTISAKCNICGDDLGSLTITKPENPVYDGEVKAATISGEITGVTIPEISYTGDNLVDGKPVNAGVYTASITLGDVTAGVEYTIATVSLEDATIADIPNQTYDGDDIIPDPVVNVKDRTLEKDTDYTVSYKDNLNAGTATITVTGKGNYAGTLYKTFVIDQAPAPTITWPLADKLTYGQSLADSKLEGGSTEYGTFAWEDDTVVPTAGDKEYTVVFTPSELTVRNYENMAVMKQSVTVTVDKATPDYTAPFGLTALYGQTLAQITLPAGWSWDAPDTSVGNAGTHEFAATFTPQDTANYDVVQKNLSVKVEPIALSVTGVTAESRLYDGTNVVKITGLTLSGMLTGDEVFVSLEGLTGTVSSAEVGDYDAVILPQLTLSGAAAANYTLTQPAEAFPTSVSIRKSDATITLKTDVYRKIYGDDAFSIAGDITTVGDAKLVYSVSNGLDSKGNPKAVDDIVTVSEEGLVTILGSGSVTVTLSMEETANYYAVSKTISIQVIAWDDIPQNGFFIRSMDVVTYTGKAIKPEPAVYDGNSENRLEKGKDYTISYKNNKKAYTLKEGDEGFNAKKAPTMIIKGKGNYDQKLTVYFTIQPKDISDLNDASVVAEDIVVEANGKVQKKTPVIKFNNKKLGKADFTIVYPALEDEALKAAAYKEPGTYPVVITGKGNFTGSRTVYLTVTAKGTNLAKATIAKIPAQEFDGVNAVELDETELVVTAKVSGKKVTLQKGVHYNVEYVNNTGIGTATVIVKAIEGSGYAGFKKATFKITGVSIAKATVEGVENKTYNGSAQEPVLKVSLGSALVEGTDYKVEYSKNTNVGTASVTIKGMGKYTGSIKKTFKITAADITSLVTDKDGEIAAKYVKGGAKPAMSLVFNGKVLTAGKDYTVTYKNNKKLYTAKAGETGYDAKKAPTITIKGKGNFAGTVSRTFTIGGRGLTDADMAVTMTVNDKVVSTKKGGYISKVVITDADGKALKQGTDYSEPVYTMLNGTDEAVTLTKEDTAPVGSVITVSVTGMGAYAGSEGEGLTATYRITEKDFGKVKVKSIQKKYTGKSVELTLNDFLNNDGTSKVTFGGKELIYGTDFEIVPGSYKNNLKKGTASVTIRGLGEYGGTKTVKFKIGARSLIFWWLN